MIRFLMRRLSLLLVFLPSLAAAQKGRPAAAGMPLGDLDQYVARVMQEWHVPGLALGVLKNGDPVVLKGYGYRDVEGKLPVTPRTLMAIGSNSKSFTVALLGMLADSGKLDWDKPVRTYLPDFQLYDPFATQEMTPKDLVTHRSGLPRHDALWYGRNSTREELYHRLKYLEPNASFRSRYQYQNLMFMTAGYLAERITGRSWDDLIRERLFTPLGMTRSNITVRDLPATDDYALAYVWRDCPTATSTSGDGGAAATAAPDCGLRKVPFRNIDAIGPAGAINSSVEEMLHYLRFRLDLGEYGGGRLLSQENAERMQTPQMLTGSPAGSYDTLGISTYGLGVSVGTYRSHKLVAHTGGIDGFISAMSWMPQDKIGVMVLTNMSGNNPVPTIVTRNVFDRLLGLNQLDWVARTKKQDAEARARQEKERKDREAERKPNTTPSHDLTAYAGTYEHPGYGRLTVQADGQGLSFSFDGFNARLKHFHYDIFEIDDPTETMAVSGRVSFLTDKKGEIDRMAVPFEPTVADIVFTRVVK